MDEDTENSNVKKTKLLRCIDWLQKQDSQEPKKLSLQNKNDIQFIIQTNADRKNFLLSAAEDEATVPGGVDEPAVEPKAVPLHRLRKEQLKLDCEWQACQCTFSDYELFQKHIKEHVKDLHVMDKEDSVEYVCLWDICGHKSPDFGQMYRHINYHAYHAKLLAIGFNGRATLKLMRCRKDSSMRNHLPPLKTEHCCMWTGCEEKFNAVQVFYDHVKLHINYSENNLCSWAGCGAMFPRRVQLTMHMYSHTGERLIACYHCGRHFCSNRKLIDHLNRQNVHPNSCYTCSVCGVTCATEYLLREHARQHVSAYACSLCDMSAPTPAALGNHMRYRHLTSEETRAHACPQCPYRAVTKYDLKKHMPVHEKQKKKDQDDSDDDEPLINKKDEKTKTQKKYACHMCPAKQMKIFSRGTRLTTHLAKVHGAQWPFGHSRFRYQISEDGMYRLTTTRYEVLEVSKRIVDGDRDIKESITNTFDFKVKLVAEATECTPKHFEIKLKGTENDEDDEMIQVKTEVKSETNSIEIEMCDVDEKGNIINSKIINSDVVFT